MELSQDPEKVDVEVSSTSVDERTTAPRSRRQKIAAVLWDSFDKAPEERKFLSKLDWFILSYCCISYFTKSETNAVLVISRTYADRLLWHGYLNQTNINNAYVSGMEDDLSMHGGQLNYLNTFWTVGYILGQLPSQLVLTKLRPSIWLPTIEIAWSVIVMGMSATKAVKMLYVCRFVIGLLEAGAYPGIMTLLANWYTPQELGKRACIFQASSSAAQMFSGYLQAGLLSADRQRAIERMESCGREPMKKLTWSVIRSILTSWPIYLFCSIFICHVLGIRIYAYMTLRLRSTEIWSDEEVNVIPSAGYGFQIIFTLTYAWVSDAIGKRWPLIVTACVVALTGSIILSVWPEHNIAAMMTGWLLTFCETGAGALIVTWVQEICSHSAEHRVIIVGAVETAAFTFQAWLPLFIYPTGKAPHFPVGYEMATMFFALELLLTLAILYCAKTWPLTKTVHE